MKQLLFIILITLTVSAYEVDDLGLAVTPKTTVKLCKPMKTKINKIIGTKNYKELTFLEKAQVLVLDHKIKLYCNECRVPYVSLKQLDDM